MISPRQVSGTPWNTLVLYMALLNKLDVTDNYKTRSALYFLDK